MDKNGFNEWLNSGESVSCEYLSRSRLLESLNDFKKALKGKVSPKEKDQVVAALNEVLKCVRIREQEYSRYRAIIGRISKGSLIYQNQN